MEHPEAAKEYSDLKRRLKEKYEYNRDAYTNAKEEFISIYSEKAKLQYGERYKTRIKKMEIN
ncbi:GrpB family protein [Aminipila sp.]|uniref:GrpB family protein n=1 Tax=Aminipila sp. TaxID=2060095 RepID=UPI003FA4197B